MKTNVLMCKFLLVFALVPFVNKSEPIDSTVWSLLKNQKPPIEISYFLQSNWQNPTIECGLGDVGENWTFPLIVGMKLTAFKEELPIYCAHIEPGNLEHRDWGLRLFAAYGIGFSGNWYEHWNPGHSDTLLYPKIMEQLKKPLIRKAVWTFIQPALKNQLKTMELKYQGIVVLSYEYVANYFKNYNVLKARDWYNKDIETRQFASMDYLGRSHPSRKITALIERLMFKWKVVDYKTVVAWIDTVGKWLKTTLGQDYTKSKVLWGK